MKTNEVERKTGLSKQTILYYEKEGLINPQRDENNYRNYSHDDIQILMLIKLLRSMNVGIDDIRLVLNNQLSVQKCLDTQSAYMKQQLEEIQNVQKDIEFFKEKHIPLIPALQDIEKIDTKTYFGFYRTTPHVSIGRKLTKKFLIKKIVLQSFYSMILSLAVTYGYYHLIGYTSFYVFLFALLFFITFIIVAFGFGFGEMSSFSTEQNISQFIEFDETGIHYHQREGFIDQFQYAYRILRGIDSLHYVRYEDIESVQIKHVLRYMKIPTTNLPTNINTIDFEFHFNNHTHLYFMNPLILDNDLVLIKTILKEKVKNYREINL